MLFNLIIANDVNNNFNTDSSRVSRTNNSRSLATVESNPTIGKAQVEKSENKF